MATYAEMLAEEVQMEAAIHEHHCYHDMDVQMRRRCFTDLIFAFCRKYNIPFEPVDE